MAAPSASISISASTTAPRSKHIRWPAHHAHPGQFHRARHTGRGAARHRAGRTCAGGARFQPLQRACRGGTRFVCAAGFAGLVYRRLRRHHGGACRRATVRARLDLEQPGRGGRAFLARNPDFVLEEPGFPFNEGAVRNGSPTGRRASSSGVEPHRIRVMGNAARAATFSSDDETTRLLFGVLACMALPCGRRRTEPATRGAARGDPTGGAAQRTRRRRRSRLRPADRDTGGDTNI